MPLKSFSEMWLEIGWLWASSVLESLLSCHCLPFELCLFFIFESDSSTHKGDQLAMWFSVSEKKIILWTMKKKEKAGAIAMGISCSYKEEGFWENRTFLWHTRTKKFIRSFLQDPPLLTSSDWQWENLCHFTLFYTLKKFIWPCSQCEESQFRRSKYQA